MSVFLGVGFFQIGANRVQIGNRLLPADSRFQVSERHEHPPVPARVQIISELSDVYDRYEQIGIKKHQSSVKLRRRDADNRKRVFAQLDDTPYHAGVILKMRVPIRIAKHNIRSAVWPLLIGRV